MIKDCAHLRNVHGIDGRSSENIYGNMNGVWFGIGYFTSTSGFG